MNLRYYQMYLVFVKRDTQNDVVLMEYNFWLSILSLWVDTNLWRNATISVKEYDAS